MFIFGNVCLSVHGGGGGGYLPWMGYLPGPGWGVPTWAWPGAYLPWPGRAGGGVPTLQPMGGGNIPTSQWGGGGVPTLARVGIPLSKVGTPPCPR